MGSKRLYEFIEFIKNYWKKIFVTHYHLRFAWSIIAFFSIIIDLSFGPFIKFMFIVIKKIF